MEIRADEISRIIREQIKDYGKKVDVAETGTVLTQADGVARVYGLAGAAAGELLDFPHGVRGLVLNLEEDNVGVALMGHAEVIREGDPVKRTGRDRFVRNVLIAIGNSADPDLAPHARRLLDDASPLVRAMAVWACARLLPQAVVAGLAAEHTQEADPAVREEWRQALSAPKVEDAA